MMRWVLPLIAASALWAHATRAAEPSLALAFGSGTDGLPHAQVVDVDAARLRLRYRSARGTLERELPYDAGAPAALISERIALLAGNLVRDQALAPPPALPALESQPAAPHTPEPEAAAPRTPEPQVAEPAPIPAGSRSESAQPKPAVPRSERSQVHAFFAVAAFTRVQVDSDIPPADAASNIGLHVRFELPISRLLTAGFGPSLSHWEGASTGDDGSANLIVSPSDIMDLQFWLRPRGRTLALDLVQPRAALGVGFAL